LRRDDVEPVRAVFADHNSESRRRGTGRPYLPVRRRSRPAADARAARPAPQPLFGSGLAQRRIGLLLFGLALGNCLFEIFDQVDGAGRRSERVDLDEFNLALDPDALAPPYRRG
jgi:hypothetical protein